MERRRHNITHHPRTISIIPRVVINDGTFRKLTTTPLIRPIKHAETNQNKYSRGTALLGSFASSFELTRTQECDDRADG